MNKTIKLAVAGAVLSAASIANAGIIIPAGEWTMDINGNVNMFAIMTDSDAATTGAGAGATGAVAGGVASSQDAQGNGDSYAMNTGLLPAWLGFTGTTRQNDLDVSFTISFQPNASDNQSSGMGDTATPLNRQAFLTFGDASWGSVKVGKDLGIFAGDAILNDMTLLGVGAGGSRSGGPTTLGGIGTGYIYPAWKGQIAYTTPNMNGFQATFGITNPQQGTDTTAANVPNPTNQERYGFEAKASYALNLGSTTGKVWVSGISNEVSIGAVDHDVTVMDIGINLNSGNAGLTAYYYSGEGAGLTTNVNGASGANAAGVERDSDGGYVQGTYVIPTGTKLGVAYGRSSLDKINAADTAILDQNERWTVGAYHPLTKHLNLVAEFNAVESKDHQGDTAESDSISLGAILFF